MHFILLDLKLSTSNGILFSTNYAKYDDIDFDIVNFSFLDGDNLQSSSYIVYMSQIIRFAMSSSHVNIFAIGIKPSSLSSLHIL